MKKTTSRSNSVLRWPLALTAGLTAGLALGWGSASPAQALGPNAMVSGFNASTLAGNDDGSTGLKIPFGFTVNFFGDDYTGAWVNNNGNITFDGPMGTYTPFNIVSTGRPLIAPFFADVDTRPAASAKTSYGGGTFDGRTAFGVTWPGVGCYSNIASVLNDFQMLLVDRSNIWPGDFDIVFNYDRVQWETGQASGGNGSCLGGSPARAGYSSGAIAFEIPGSGISGAFLDTNSSGLANTSRNSSQTGRHIFQVRNGIVANTSPTVTAPADQSAPVGTSTAITLGSFSDPDGGPWTASVNWGDGSTDTNFSASSAGSLGTQSHTYPTAGTRTVTVTVTDITSQSGSASFRVSVLAPANLPPTANPGGPYSAPEGGSVLLNGSGTDPEGQPLTYAWDLDNNGTFETPGQNPTFSAAGRDGPGSSTVTLQVCDGGTPLGCASSPATVNVVNVAPTITSVSNNGPINEGGSATITVTATDPAGPADTLVLRGDCNNDGTFETLPTGMPQLNLVASAPVTCPFPDNGAFQVNVEVTDGDGGTATGSTTVFVNNLPPTANAGGPYSVPEGSSVGLTGSGFDVPADTLSYAWDLDNNGSYETPGQNVTFSAPGLDGPSLLAVVLQVCDDDGACATSSRTIAVSNVPPSLAANQASVTVDEGQTATNTGTYSDPSPGDDVQITAAGATVTKIGTNTGTWSWSFAANDGPESRTVTINASDGDGGLITTTFTLVVNNVAPNVSLSGPTTADEGQTKTYSLAITDPGLDSFTFVSGFPSCGTGGSLIGPPPVIAINGLTFQCRFADGPASPSVSVQVRDSDGADSNVASLAVAVSNVAPSVVAGIDAAIDEGQTFTRHGPISNWRAEGTGYDSADNNPGTLQNGATFATGVNGQAFSFDGIDDYVQVADAANLRPPRLTLEAWVQPRRTGVMAGIVTKEPTSASSQLGYGFRQRSNDTFWFLISREGFGVAVAESTTTLVPGNWYHLVGTYDGAQAKLYVNGVLEGTGNGAATIDSTFPLRIGRLNSGIEPFLGRVDEVSLFSVVLAASSVATRYGAGGNAHVGQFFDPGSDTFTATVDYGDGSGVQPLTVRGRAFDLTHLYADNGAYNVTVCVTDDDHGTGCDTAVVTVNNVAPTIAPLVSGPAIDEGSSATINVSATDPAGPADTLVYRLDCNNDGTFETEMLALSLTSASGACTFTDNGTFTVGIEVTDGDGGRATTTTTITVNNVPPRVAADNASVTVNEGQTATNTGTYSDPATGDDVQITASTGTVTKTGTNSGTWSWSFGTNDGPDQSQTVTITANDGDGGVTTTSFALTVNNVAPTVSLSGPTSANEGQTKTYSFTVTDPGQDTFTVTATGCGASGSVVAGSLTTTASGGSFQCAFPDDNPTDTASDPSTVSVQVADSDGAPSNTASLTVTVSNIAPVANAGPDQSQYWGLPVPFNGSVTDLGTQDTHTASWTFGDGPATASGFSVSHTYANPGGYTATLTVTDDDTGVGTDTALATINKRGTSLAYTGDSTTTFGYAATLKAQLTDSVDPDTAQLGGKTITFLVDGTISLQGTTNASGVASATLAPFPPLMPGPHTIAVSFAGDSHYLASAAQSSLQVGNTANGKVTAGTLRAANNGRGGFNVQADATGATVKGELQFQNNSLNFHAPTMTDLGVAPDKKSAWFAGTGRDGQAFVAYVEDNGEPGTNDTYRLWVTGTPQNGTGAITGGNVQIH